MADNEQNKLTEFYAHITSAVETAARQSWRLTRRRKEINSPAIVALIARELQAAARSSTLCEAVSARLCRLTRRLEKSAARTEKFLPIKNAFINIFQNNRIPRSSSYHIYGL